MPHEPIDRRTALRAAFALGASGAMFLLRGFDVLSPPLIPQKPQDDVASALWSIRGGSGLGPIALGMRQQQVVELLGPPPKTFDFEGASAEVLRRALGDKYDPEVHRPVAPRFFLQYLDMGFSVEIMDSVVTEINAYTGHLAGYQKGDYAPFQGRVAAPEFTLLSTQDEIATALGPPSRSGDNPYATIPDEWMHYHYAGLKFDFNAESKRLSCVSVCPSWAAPDLSVPSG